MEVIDFKTKKRKKIDTKQKHIEQKEKDSEWYEDLIKVLSQLVEKDTQMKCYHCQDVSPKHKNNCPVIKARRLLESTNPIEPLHA